VAWFEIDAQRQGAKISLEPHTHKRGEEKMRNPPIQVQTFEFSNPEDLRGQFMMWGLKGSHKKLTIIAAAQSSWLSGKQARHLVTIYYTEEE